MKYFLQSIGPLLRDFLSTIAFVIALSVLHDTQKAILVGIVVGLVTIAIDYARHRKLGFMQLASLFLVLSLGGASLLTHDPRFVMIKPSIGYAAIGVVMLKRGWMTAYVPPIALDYVPEKRFVVWGYVWAGLMLFSAVGNLVLVGLVDLKTWASVLLVWGIASKATLFLAQYAAIRIEARVTSRRRQTEAAAEAAL